MAPKHRARKLLGATVGLASISLVGSACTSGNLVVYEYDAPEEHDAGMDSGAADTGASDAGKATADTGSTEDAGQNESDSGT